MSFEKYLTQQLSLHPSMQYQDMLKLSFQAAFGAEHLLEDYSYAKKVLEDEFDNIIARDVALYEEISDEHIRINLAAWKFKNLPLSWLFNIFTASAKMNRGNADRFKEYLAICETKADKATWDKFITDYLCDGIRPVHHSEIYREKEAAAYRLANKCFVNTFEILEAAAGCKFKPCVIAIDGRAASGKSTLASLLSQVMGASVIHMDDFFLPPSLRTENRLSEVGGNIHYERYIEEVLPYIRGEKSFSYNKFSCSKMDYDGRQEISGEEYRIVEGVYSLHSNFGDYADICVFSDIEPTLQLERIVKRDGEYYARRFSTEWIPMEEAYFEGHKIREKCTLHIKINSKGA